MWKRWKEKWHYWIRKYFGNDIIGFKGWYRWLFWRCMDCGVKLKNEKHERGDVCPKCFDDFNGLTIEEIIGKQ